MEMTGTEYEFSTVGVDNETVMGKHRLYAIFTPILMYPFKLKSTWLYPVR